MLMLLQLNWSIQICDATAYDDYRSVVDGIWPPEDDPQSRAEELVTDLPRLRMDAINVRSRTEDSRNDIARVLEHAKAANQQISTWLEHLTDDYDFSMHGTEHTGEDAPRWIYIHKSKSAAINWLHWRLNRLRVLYIIQMCTSMLDSSTPDTPRAPITTTETLQHLIEDIYCSVPYDQATFVANQRIDSPENRLSATQHSPFQDAEVAGNWLLLRALELGSPIGPVAGVEFVGGRPVPWCREYIRLYAQYPFADAD